MFVIIIAALTISATLQPDQRVRVTWSQPYAGTVCLTDTTGRLRTCVQGQAGENTLIDEQPDGNLRWQVGDQVCVWLPDPPTTRIGCSAPLVAPVRVWIPFLAR